MTRNIGLPINSQRREAQIAFHTDDTSQSNGPQLTSELLNLSVQFNINTLESILGKTSEKKH